MQVVFGLRAHPRALVVEAEAGAEEALVAVEEEFLLRAAAAFRPPVAAVAVLEEAVAGVIPRELSRRLDYLAAWDWRVMLRATFRLRADLRHQDVLPLRHQVRVADQTVVV